MKELINYLEQEYNYFNTREEYYYNLAIQYKDTKNNDAYITNITISLEASAQKFRIKNKLQELGA